MKKLILFFLLCISCTKKNHENINKVVISSLIQTEKVQIDIDDPAIWYNKSNPANSLIIGTQKDENGALIVYDLEGKIDKDKSIYNISRPNNVDIIHEVNFGESKVDIMVTTERYKNRIRIFSLPDMKELDAGGLRVFSNEENPEPMGVALWKDEDGFAHAIVGKKYGL